MTAHCQRCRAKTSIIGTANQLKKQMNPGESMTKLASRLGIEIVFQPPKEAVELHEQRQKRSKMELLFIDHSELHTGVMVLEFQKKAVIWFKTPNANPEKEIARMIGYLFLYCWYQTKEDEHSKKIYIHRMCESLGSVRNNIYGDAELFAETMMGPNAMTVSEFRKIVETKIAESKDLRFGQAVYNELARINYSYADMIRTTELDCYYNNDVAEQTIADAVLHKVLEG